MRQVTVRGVDGLYRSGPAGAWWLNPPDGEMRQAIDSGSAAAVALYPLFAAYVRLTERRYRARQVRERAEWRAIDEARRPVIRAALAEEHDLDGCHERFGCHKGCRYAATPVGAEEKAA